MTFRFESDGERQIVRMQTRILYKLIGIPFYRFEQDSTETWQNGRLLSLQSQTNDDGNDYTLEVKAVGADIQVTVNGRSQRQEDTNMPASLWNPATYRESALFDTKDGKHFDVDGRAENGHFTLTGTLNREIWYDQQSVLADVRFTARDGSEIRYVRD